MARHSLDFWLTSEDLPDPENRVTLDRDGRIVLAYKPNNEEGHKRLIAKLEELMKQQRACSLHGGDCHQGHSPETSSLGNAFHSQALRIRMAPSDSATIRKRQRST